MKKITVIYKNGNKASWNEEDAFFEDGILYELPSGIFGIDHAGWRTFTKTQNFASVEITEV